jgi:peptide/nickel transport system substrate-binding protein
MLAMRLRKLGAIAVAPVLVAALASGPTGCGSSSDAGNGGTLTGSSEVFPDHLDPGLSFSAEGWTAMQNSYIPLLTYAHASGLAGTRVIPGLAKALPKVSDDGRIYTLYLRPGLKYSDGTPVRASDFPATIERLFEINSPGISFYTDIAGAERFEKTKKGGIPGIEADDKTGRITIHLLKPRGTFDYELALMFAAPLPPGTPAEDQTPHPPPATGPYEITDVHSGRSWETVRNPVWASTNSELMPSLPSGHVDRIEMQVIKNPETQVDDIEAGRTDWMKNPPGPERYAEVARRYEGTQFRAEPTISIYYFWMNSQQPPFNDVKVRRAVNYAVDPAALERIYAGTLTATQQVLPPAMPGYRRFQLYPHDMAKAKQLIAEADPSDRDITVWTNNAPPNDEAGEYYEQVLEKLGFQTTLKDVSATNYFTLIGNASTPNLDTGWANWLLDYPHPNDYFGPQLSGESIVPTGNTNWAHFDDPKLNRKIARLGREQLGPKQEAEYAALDREVMEQAPWAPFGNLSYGIFVAKAIDLEKVIYSPIFGQDLTSFQFK